MKPTVPTTQPQEQLTDIGLVEAARRDFYSNRIPVAVERAFASRDFLKAQDVRRKNLTGQLAVTDRFANRSEDYRPDEIEESDKVKSEVERMTVGNILGGDMSPEEMVKRNDQLHAFHLQESGRGVNGQPNVWQWSQRDDEEMRAFIDNEKRVAAAQANLEAVYNSPQTPEAQAASRQEQMTPADEAAINELLTDSQAVKEAQAIVQAAGAAPGEAIRSFLATSADKGVN